MNRPTIYAIDFDGTIVRDAWPGIGDPIPEVCNLILNIQKRGDKWILYTMREGELLDKALKECERIGLKPDAVNDNIKSMQELFGNNPRKIYADVYIDDHNAGGLRLDNQESSKSTTPFCDDCRYRLPIWPNDICVYGNMSRSCKILRDTKDLCGPEGKWFDPNKVVPV